MSAPFGRSQRTLPYGRHNVAEDDVQAVAEALRSGWLTTGPRVDAFEEAFALATGARHAVAVANGTAALHAAVHSLGLGQGDEVIVPPLTFAATANAVLYEGATPVFADVDADTLLLDPLQVQAALTARTRAVIAVDYAGQPCDYDALNEVARHHGLELISDACHALGGSFRGRPVGSLADLSTFSFHPVKPITTAEGGMVTTDRADRATSLRTFRNHGIATDHRQRARLGTWSYEMVDLGFNYRLSDVHAALGLAQLKHLPAWVKRRQSLARRYDEAFAGWRELRSLKVREEVAHAYHLYVVRLNGDDASSRRQAVFEALREEGIGAAVHYPPVHLHPYYRRRLGTGPGLCPVAEEAARGILSLPLFPAMEDSDVDRVVAVLARATGRRPS